MLALLHKCFFLVMVIYLSSEMFCDGSDEENFSHIYKNLLGFDFDMDYVIREYMKVCPTVTICGDKNESFIDTLTEYDLFNLPIQCPNCSCEQDCVINNNCCPDVIYGYLQYDCVSSVKHKGKEFYNEEKFSMIASCPQSWVASHNMTKQRESILPVTSFLTGLTYQTVEFAQCNGDNKSLATWNTTFYCQKFTGFFRGSHYQFF
ncbi:uncharacterized protein LOC132759938 [Ruditapes philippinarum]|uniref:uncharacterized protein LOC132759938 n=1 Tax=Ruditapes philippinarum TaxID=129788 RepID=UPI00295BE599|nr:uncharacterized protein LOC132759938 [Ruditapes philippinarum]